MPFEKAILTEITTMNHLIVAMYDIKHSFAYFGGLGSNLN